MKYDVNKPETVSSGSLESVEIHLGETDVVFDLLRKQYTFPIQTPLQEMLSNARDSHRQAKQSRKVEVRFPTESYPFFTTRDFGISMSPETFKSIWAGMGNSTKKESDEFTGGFGIGSKAWFAYRNNWFYKIYYGGKVRTYEITTALKYSGSAELRDESDSNEPQGIEVIVPVNKGDETKFESAFYRTTLFWTENERPLVKNRDIEELSEHWKNTHFFMSLIPEITLVNPETIKSFSRSYQQKTDLILSIDGIPYIINAKLLDSRLSGDHAFEAQDGYQPGRDRSQEIMVIKDSLKELAPICDILRCANANEKAFVPVFNIKTGKIKLVNHRENIDLGQDNVSKAILLLKEYKVKLDLELLNQCRDKLTTNNYKEAREFSLTYQPHWIITEEKNKYQNFFQPSPFEFKQDVVRGRSSWSWIHFNSAQLRNLVEFSYHKDTSKVLKFEMNKPLYFNPRRRSIILLKDDVVKKEIYIKKKMNNERIEDLYVLNLANLPENVQEGFRDLCDNLTFGEWWLKTGLLDQEKKKVVKKDTSLISLHYMDNGKRYSESKKFDDFKDTPKFQKTIFIKMKDNRPDTDLPYVTFLFDFIKYFFNTFTAMVTEENYEKLQNLMEDDFIDFNDYLNNLRNPSDETYSQMRTLFFKGFLHKTYVNHDYEFKTFRPLKNIRQNSTYTTELSLYLMMNKVDLKLNQVALNKLNSISTDFKEIQGYLTSISDTEASKRIDLKMFSSKMDLFAQRDLLIKFPKLYSLLETIEGAFIDIEQKLLSAIPYIQYIQSNEDRGYYQNKEKGKEHNIHPYIIENIKRLE